MDSIWLDFRYACRALLNRPGFTALAILTLGLGIGANTVAFSAINALLLRQFRVAEPDRVGWVLLPGAGNPRGAVSLADLDALTKGTQSFDAITAEGRIPVSLRTAAGTEQAWALLVTTNYLPTIHAAPERGRLFTDADLRRGDLPAIVSHRFWRERLGGPESLGGLTIMVNGRSFPVVGVMPDDFRGFGGLYAPEMWLPLERVEVLNLPATMRGAEWLTLFCRLRPGVAEPQAQSELMAFARQLAPSTPPGTEAARSGRFYPVTGGHPELKEIRQTMWLAFGAVGVVLLIACFNVAALLMARAAERQKEIAIRSAVGASRGRILRQLLVEGLLLASLGGTAALVLAAWSSELLSTFSLPSPIPLRLHLGIDRMLVLFTAAAVVAAGIFPALLPALQSTRSNVLRSMRMEPALRGRPSRTRNVFVVAQIAGATLFVSAALLFVRSFTHTIAVDPGLDAAHTVALELSPGLYGYDAARAKAFVDALQARLAVVSGVRAVSVADRAPYYVGGATTTTFSAGAPCTGPDCRRATTYGIGRRHFSALGVPLTSGRDFTDAELRTGAAVIVSQQLAAQTWPGESPLGRSLRLGAEGRQVEVIGVAADYVHRNVSDPPAPYVYLPLTDAQYGSDITVLVGTRDDPRRLLNVVREQVRALDPQLPPGAISTLAERMKMPQWMPRTAAGFFTICGALALLLATVGLFGVMYFTVAQRTREFGIRVALGASPRQVTSVVVGEGLRLAVPGVLLGVCGGLVVGRLLARALFGVTPADPVSFGAAALIQLAVALAACALPAYRATRADPMAALRQE